LASLHQAHLERLRRLGALPIPIERTQPISAPEPMPLPEPERKPLSRIRILQRCVATAFDLPYQDVIEPSRRLRRVRARQAGMYLARELLEFSLLGIGRKFGVCDHTSAVRACRFIQDLMISDMEFRERVRRRALISCNRRRAGGVRDDVGADSAGHAGRRHYG
jgi:hypothetical protein